MDDSITYMENDDYDIVIPSTIPQPPTALPQPPTAPPPPLPPTIPPTAPPPPTDAIYYLLQKNQKRLIVVAVGTKFNDKQNMEVSIKHIFNLYKSHKVNDTSSICDLIVINVQNINNSSKDLNKNIKILPQIGINIPTKQYINTEEFLVSNDINNASELFFKMDMFLMLNLISILRLNNVEKDKIMKLFCLINLNINNLLSGNITSFNNTIIDNIIKIIMVVYKHIKKFKKNKDNLIIFFNKIKLFIESINALLENIVAANIILIKNYS